MHLKQLDYSGRRTKRTYRRNDGARNMSGHPKDTRYATIKNNTPFWRPLRDEKDDWYYGILKHKKKKQQEYIRDEIQNETK